MTAAANTSYHRYLLKAYGARGLAEMAPVTNREANLLDAYIKKTATRPGPRREGGISG